MYSSDIQGPRHTQYQAVMVTEIDPGHCDALSNPLAREVEDLQ